MSEGPAIAWVEAVGAVARLVGEVPLPRKMITVENGDWKLTLNNSGELHALADGTELDKYDCLAEGKIYFSFAIVSPAGGCIGGMPEDQFIAEMKAMLPLSSRNEGIGG